MRAKRRAPRLVLRGAVAWGVVALLLWSALALRVPFLPRGDRVVTAHLPSAANARPGQPVRVRGVDVGKIDALEPAAGGGVLARLRLDESVDLHRDARVSLRWRTMFGRNMTIDLDPGSASAPALGNATIPLRAAGAQVEWDQLFEPLDARGRRAVQTTLAELSDALLAPQPPRAAARQLAPTMDAVERGLRPLRGTSPGDLSRVVRRTGAIAAALGRSEDELAGLLDHGVTTLGVTAARRADIRRLLRVSPGALGRTRSTLRRLDATLDVLDPLVSELAPAAGRVAPAIRTVRPALRTLRVSLNRLAPTFDALSGALDGLRRTERSARPLAETLTPTLRRVQDRLLPGLERVDDQTGLRLYQAIGPWFAAATSSVGEYDAGGHMVRFQVNGGAGTFLDLVRTAAGR